MMDTLFLATVIGWFLIIISMTLFFRPDHMKSVMEDVIAHPGLFFVFAVFTLVLGLLMVVSHNIWFMGWPIIITLFSWLVLISGIIRLTFPDATMKIGRSYFNHPLRMQITGAILLVIGLFLLFHVYYLHM